MRTAYHLWSRVRGIELEHFGWVRVSSARKTSPIRQTTWTSRKPSWTNPTKTKPIYDYWMNTFHVELTTTIYTYLPRRPDVRLREEHWSGWDWQLRRTAQLLIGDCGMLCGGDRRRGERRVYARTMPKERRRREARWAPEAATSVYVNSAGKY